MGICANVEFVEYKSVIHYLNLDVAMKDFRGKMGGLEVDEEVKLKAYLLNQLKEKNGGLEPKGLQGGSKSKWALIWWEKESARIEINSQNNMTKPYYGKEGPA